jgi:hypothetical protein
MHVSLMCAVFSVELPVSKCGLTKTEGVSEEVSRKVQEIELVAEKILLPLLGGGHGNIWS